MHNGKQLLQLRLKGPVFGALVELGDEVAANLQGVEGESKSCSTEVLITWQKPLA